MDDQNKYLEGQFLDEHHIGKFCSKNI